MGKDKGVKTGIFCAAGRLALIRHDPARRVVFAASTPIAVEIM